MRRRVGCAVIDPITEAEQNIFHLLLFFPVPVSSVTRPSYPLLPPSPYSCAYIYDVLIVPHLRRRNHPPRISTAIPILSCISATSVIIIPHISYGPHRIVFHFPASFNTICVTCIYISHSYLSLYISPPGRRFLGGNFTLPFLLLILF